MQSSANFLRTGFLKHDSTKSRVSNESNNNNKRKPKATSITRKFRFEKHEGIAEREKNRHRLRKKGI